MRSDGRACIFTNGSRTHFWSAFFHRHTSVLRQLFLASSNTVNAIWVQDVAACRGPSMSASSSRPASSLKLSQDKFFSVSPKEDLNEAGASRKGSRKSLLHRGSAKGWFHRTVDEDDTRRFSNTFEKPVPLGELDRFRQDVDKRDSALESAATDKLSQKVNTYVFSKFFSNFWKTLRGSFSAVSKPNFASKYSLESS